MNKSAITEHPQINNLTILCLTLTPNCYSLQFLWKILMRHMHWSTQQTYPVASHCRPNAHDETLESVNCYNSPLILTGWDSLKLIVQMSIWKSRPLNWHKIHGQTWPSVCVLRPWPWNPDLETWTTCCRQLNALETYHQFGLRKSWHWIPRNCSSVTV